MEALQFFAALRPADPVAVARLQLVPLLFDAGGPDADLLEESAAEGRTTVTEVGESGVVNRVRVAHAGPRDLLLIDGEQIVGAKQNRVMNASFLVPRGTAVEVPVSCVESGRWAYRGATFAASGTTLTASARAAKLRRVTTSLGLGAGYDANQRAVWRDVDNYLERTGTHSPSSAFHDAFAQRAATVEQTVSRLAPLPGQVGLAAVAGERLVSLDVFGSHELYARAWKKVARGLLADVADPTETGSPAHGRDAVARVRDALAAVVAATLGRAPAPGGGETVHGEAGPWVFSALVSGGQLYHALAVSK